MILAAFFSFLSELDWKQIWEWFIPAAMAFVFAGVLQWRLMARQENFLTKLEKDRAANDEKAENRRIAFDARIAAEANATNKKIAMEDRNLQRQLESRRPRK